MVYFSQRVHFLLIFPCCVGLNHAVVVSLICLLTSDQTKVGRGLDIESTCRNEGAGDVRLRIHNDAGT